MINGFLFPIIGMILLVAFAQRRPEDSNDSFSPFLSHLHWYLSNHLLVISTLFFFSRSEGTTLLKYKIPTRGLLGLRNSILTASRGTAVLNTIFDSYGPWAGDISTRDQGSLVISLLLFIHQTSNMIALLPRTQLWDLLLIIESSW